MGQRPQMGRWLMIPHGADFRPEKANLRSWRADLKPERAEFWPEKANLRFTIADLRPEISTFTLQISSSRPQIILLRPEIGPMWNQRSSAPPGPLEKAPCYLQNMVSCKTDAYRLAGIADYMLPLGHWFGWWSSRVWCHLNECLSKSLSPLPVVLCILMASDQRYEALNHFS